MRRTCDLLCANIPENFMTLTREFLSSWLLYQEYCSQLPRGDNSDTPVRMTPRGIHLNETFSSAIETIASPMRSENVTILRGGLRCGRPLTDSLAPDNILAIIREEQERVIDDRFPTILGQLLDRH